VANGCRDHCMQGRIMLIAACWAFAAAATRQTKQFHTNRQFMATRHFCLQIQKSATKERVD